MKRLQRLIERMFGLPLVIVKIPAGCSDEYIETLKCRLAEETGISKNSVIVIDESVSITKVWL